MEPIKILVTNQKGGVGKSTISANLAAYLCLQQGVKVSLIDFDKQGSSSRWAHKAPNIGIQVHQAELSFQSSGMTLLSARNALRKGSIGSDVSISDLTWMPSISEDFMMDFDLILVPTSTSKFELASTEIFVLQYALKHFAKFPLSRQLILVVPSRVEREYSSANMPTNLSCLDRCLITPPVIRTDYIDQYVYEDFFCVSNDKIVSDYFCQFGEFIADKVKIKIDEKITPVSKVVSNHSIATKKVSILDRFRIGRKQGLHAVDQPIPQYLYKSDVKH